MLASQGVRIVTGTFDLEKQSKQTMVADAWRMEVVTELAESARKSQKSWPFVVFQ